MACTVIPTEIPTYEYQAIPTNEYQQYQPRGGGYDTNTRKVVSIDLVCNSNFFCAQHSIYKKEEKDLILCAGEYSVKT